MNGQGSPALPCRRPSLHLSRSWVGRQVAGSFKALAALVLKTQITIFGGGLVFFFFCSSSSSWAINENGAMKLADNDSYVHVRFC